MSGVPSFQARTNYTRAGVPTVGRRDLDHLLAPLRRVEKVIVIFTGKSPQLQYSHKKSTCKAVAAIRFKLPLRKPGFSHFVRKRVSSHFKRIVHTTFISRLNSYSLYL
jgi:hypothetical protein